MPGRAGRPKSEAKVEAILNAATELFLAKGFQGASTDAVARPASVSKQTVYSYFVNVVVVIRFAGIDRRLRTGGSPGAGRG
jgi:AcrR family transcriptional regulator